jgi:hypothetical protein
MLAPLWVVMQQHDMTWNSQGPLDPHCHIQQGAKVKRREYRTIVG